MSALRNASESHLTKNALAFKMLRKTFNRPPLRDLELSSLRTTFFIMHIKKCNLFYE